MTETITGAGAMPGSGATPGQPAAATSSSATLADITTATSPAMGEAALGEAGQKVLREARQARREAEDRARTAEEERDALKAASQSDVERAIAKARRDGAAESTTKFQAQLRRAGVKSALVAAGVNAELLDLVTRDDVFADLDVTEDGEVAGLDAAIAALRKARPSIFGKPGDFGGGNRGATPETPVSMDALLRAAARN